MNELAPQRWKNILFNIVLCLNCLLLLFVIAGEHIHVPAWLQVAGRMHPLLLHFPIVLLLLYIFWTVFLAKRLSGPEEETGKWLLLMVALTAVVTALMGFFLSREDGYNQAALRWHKWSGVGVSVVSLVWYGMRDAIHRTRWLPQAAAALSFVLILFTGHQGSAITHGDNYLFAPVTPERVRPKVPLETAVIYADMVEPILETKCMSCHNSTKAKGQLVMESKALLLKGGRHGALWTSGSPGESLLIERIMLPDAEKKHMPPAGKPQLDADESAILSQWIRQGADFNRRVRDLPPTDSLRILAAGFLLQPEAETYDFSAAAEKTIEQLNTTNRIVHPLAIGSPALAVNFYNRQFYTTESLKALEAVKNQVVTLDMAYMPVKEADLAIISQFSNLRELNLNFSTAPGSAIRQLQKLPQLKRLSLSGTGVKSQDLAALPGFPSLHDVYLWNDEIAVPALAALKKKNPAINYETGFMNDSLVLKLNPPVLETEERIINGQPLTMHLKHYIKGVSIRYTLDGSKPDSMASAEYKGDFQLSQKAVFKARAFKKGWLGSDSIMATFYKNTYRADAIKNLTALDSVYKGSAGAATLIDGEKGSLSRNNKWLGFRRNKLDMLLHYPAPVTVSSVTLSAQVDINAYIFPPYLIEVSGGRTEKSMKRLGVIRPQQPDSARDSYLTGYDINFPPTTINYLRVTAVPVDRLPSWHAAKQQKGWLFTDEFFVN
jgi:uncharacterized membrane protein